MHLHLPVRTARTPRTPRRLTVCAVVSAAALTAPSAAALDPPGRAPATALPIAGPTGSTDSPSAVTESIADTGTSKTKPKKKTKKVRFARNSEAIVKIRSVRVSRFVYRGAQRTIDRGVVAHYTGWQGTFVRPGRPGVYWLAAHNYGRSGPFHRLLKVKRGALIKVTTRSGHRYVYRVHKLRVVPTHVPRSVIWGKWGPKSGPSRAVLQTCKGSKRLLVYATLLKT